MRYDDLMAAKPQQHAHAVGRIAVVVGYEDSGMHYRQYTAGGRVIVNSDQRRTSILFVCLGNICRSPTAEGVLRHLIAGEAPGLNVEVDSAGTADYHVGEPPDRRSQHAALRRGIDLSGLRARRVVPGDFLKFDLILAMDRQNL